MASRRAAAANRVDFLGSDAKDRRRCQGPRRRQLIDEKTTRNGAATVERRTTTSANTAWQHRVSLLMAGEFCNSATQQYSLIVHGFVYAVVEPRMDVNGTMIRVYWRSFAVPLHDTVCAVGGKGAI